MTLYGKVTTVKTTKPPRVYFYFSKTNIWSLMKLEYQIISIRWHKSVWRFCRIFSLCFFICFFTWNKKHSPHVCPNAFIVWKLETGDRKRMVWKEATFNITIFTSGNTYRINSDVLCSHYLNINILCARQAPVKYTSFFLGPIPRSELNYLSAVLLALFYLILCLIMTKSVSYFFYSSLLRNKHVGNMKYN